MKLELPKLSQKTLLKLGLRVLFVLIVVYEVYSLFGIYRSLNQEDTNIVKASGASINQSAYKKASDRYTSTLEYKAEPSTIKDSFKAPPEEQ